jgi:hypothetical protein
MAWWAGRHGQGMVINDVCFKQSDRTQSDLRQQLELELTCVNFMGENKKHAFKHKNYLKGTTQITQQ